MDRGFHPLSYRLMCLQAHYRSELEFDWAHLLSAQTRLKRMILSVERLKDKAADMDATDMLTHPKLTELRDAFDAAMCDDLNTAKALTLADDLLSLKKVNAAERMALLAQMDAFLGLELLTLSREDLRVRPANADIDEAKIEQLLDKRVEARKDKDFAMSDKIRDELIAKGVEVMDGDPLGWDWAIKL